MGYAQFIITPAECMFNPFICKNEYKHSTIHGMGAVYDKNGNIYKEFMYCDGELISYYYTKSEENIIFFALNLHNKWLLPEPLD